MTNKARYFAGKREITYEEYLKLTGQKKPEVTKEVTKEVKPKKKK